MIGSRIIRQVAALPYRIEGAASQIPLRVLLVTSRESRRWVIPKGNLPRGLAPHQGAAMEAEEEAGVIGRISATPLGSYSYPKRRPNGTARMVDVAVFPLAVTQELAAWKEDGERERRWFPVHEAADAVDEEDLRDLIRSFVPPRL